MSEGSLEYVHIVIVCASILNASRAGVLCDTEATSIYRGIKTLYEDKLLVHQAPGMLRTCAAIGIRVRRGKEAGAIWIIIRFTWLVFHAPDPEDVLSETNRSEALATVRQTNWLIQTLVKSLKNEMLLVIVPVFHDFCVWLCAWDEVSSLPPLKLSFVCVTGPIFHVHHEYFTNIYIFYLFIYL